MSSTPRRTVARAVAAVAVVASVGLTGCGAGAWPAPTAVPAGALPSAAPEAAAAPPVAVPDPVVMIIRHGEKPDGSAPGVDANGHEDESSLTAVGWQRAQRLVGLFDPVHGPLPPGPARPNAIYSARANDEGEGLRTRETVAPLAAALGIPVDTSFGKGDEEQLAAHIVAHPGVTLIAWQHGEIPDIVDAFGNVTPTPPDEWPDDRFDVVRTLTRAGDGWHFTQTPERVLPQDPTRVIEG